MSAQTVHSICSSPGCTHEVHASGMCNPHYLVWYREQRQDLETEVRKVLTKLGPPADYFCDGADDCKEHPVRWWVKAGDRAEPHALCHTHTEAILADLRKEVRRLELKV